MHALFGTDVLELCTLQIKLTSTEAVLSLNGPGGAGQSVQGGGGCYMRGGDVGRVYMVYLTTIYLIQDTSV